MLNVVTMPSLFLRPVPPSKTPRGASNFALFFLSPLELRERKISCFNLATWTSGEGERERGSEGGENGRRGKSETLPCWTASRHRRGDGGLKWLFND